MAGSVPMSIRKERSKQLHILSEKKKRAFYQSQLNSNQSVLFEAEEDGGMMYGFTENYVKVKSAFQHDLINKIVPIQLVEIDRDGVMKVELISDLV